MPVRPGCRVTTREAALVFPCSRCGAAVDQRCVTRSGVRSYYPHGERWFAVQEVIRVSGFAAELDRAERLRVEQWRALRQLRAELAAEARGLVDRTWLLARLDEIGEWR